MTGSRTKLSDLTTNNDNLNKVNVSLLLEEIRSMNNKHKRVALFVCMFNIENIVLFKNKSFSIDLVEQALRRNMDRYNSFLENLTTSRLIGCKRITDKHSITENLILKSLTDLKTLGLISTLNVQNKRYNINEEAETKLKTLTFFNVNSNEISSKLTQKFYWLEHEIPEDLGFFLLKLKEGENG